MKFFVIIIFAAFIFITNTFGQETWTGMNSIEQFAHSEIGPIPIYKNESGKMIAFVSQMQVNTDGAPDSYHPDNKGITHICNGIGIGRECRWKSDCLMDFFRARAEDFLGATEICFFGLAADQRGLPILQKEGDPRPGYYVSTTALKQPGFAENTPQAQLDSNEIPFIVIPKHWQTDKYQNIQLGDFAAVYRKSNKTLSFAIVGDLGPAKKLGEGSVALHRALENDPFTMRPDGHLRAYHGIAAGDVVYLIFPNTRKSGQIITRELIEKEGSRLLSILDFRF